MNSQKIAKKAGNVCIKNDIAVGVSLVNNGDTPTKNMSVKLSFTINLLQTAIICIGIATVAGVVKKYKTRANKIKNQGNKK